MIRTLALSAGTTVFSKAALDSAAAAAVVVLDNDDVVVVVVIVVVVDLHACTPLTWRRAPTKLNEKK